MLSTVHHTANCELRLCGNTHVHVLYAKEKQSQAIATIRAFLHFVANLCFARGAASLIFARCALLAGRHHQTRKPEHTSRGTSENVDPQTVSQPRACTTTLTHSPTTPTLSPRLAFVPQQEGGSQPAAAASQKPKGPKRFTRETKAEHEKIKRAIQHVPPVSEMLPAAIVALFVLVAQAKSVSAWHHSDTHRVHP